MSTSMLSGRLVRICGTTSGSSDGWDCSDWAAKEPSFVVKWFKMAFMKSILILAGWVLPPDFSTERLNSWQIARSADRLIPCKLLKSVDGHPIAKRAWIVVWPRDLERLRNHQPEIIILTLHAVSLCLYWLGIPMAFSSRGIDRTWRGLCVAVLWCGEDKRRGSFVHAWCQRSEQGWKFAPIQFRAALKS